MGGRKFAFQNVGPLGCQPELKQQYNLSGGACVEVLQAIASLHNSLLSNITTELQSQLSGFEYLIFDFFNSLNDMINYPTKYGTLYIGHNFFFSFKCSDVISLLL